MRKTQQEIDHYIQMTAVSIAGELCNGRGVANGSSVDVNPCVEMIRHELTTMLGLIGVKSYEESVEDFHESRWYPAGIGGNHRG